jgi:hypothetical protein
MFAGCYVVMRSLNLNFYLLQLTKDHNSFFNNKDINMDKLVAAIQGLSTTDENDLKQLKNTLAKSEDVLFKSLPSLDEALSVLDPNGHTLGWLYIL